MTRLITTFLIFITSFCYAFGQSEKEVLQSLDKIDVEGDYGYYALRYKAWNPQIREYPDTEYNNYENIIRAQVGDIVYENDKDSKSSFIHKIIKKEHKRFNQVKYLYLNGNTLSKSEIDSIRTIITTKYLNGTPFDELFLKYNMDGSPSSLLTWYSDEKKFVEEFEKEADKHKKGDIYTVDVPKNKWYYVCLKTEDTEVLKVTKSIKIQYDRN